VTTLVDITRALADESRLRILGALRGGELCVCQIVELLGLASSTTSKHLSQLRAAGLITSRKSGRWIHYRLAETAAERSSTERLATGALEWVLSAMEAEAFLREDEARLDQILSAPAEVISARQRDACCAPGTESQGGERGAAHRSTTKPMEVSDE